MSIKSATTAPAAKSKERDRTNDASIQVARISSAATIQVTRTQVICTIIASLLTLLGVAVVNLDKFTLSTPTRPVNELLTNSKVERVHDFIEKNQQDAQSAQTTVFKKATISKQQKEIIVVVLDTYKIRNQESNKQFAKEKVLLNQAMQTNNAAAIEVSRQRLNQIAIEDASTLQDTISTINQTIHPPNTDLNKEVNKTAEEPPIEKLSNRKPVIELSKLLPIKREIPLEKTEVALAEQPICKFGSPCKIIIRLNLFNDYGHVPTDNPVGFRFSVGRTF